MLSVLLMMDYEIDIEEHDVLDNPFIKRVFPDISVIKKEITQYFEEPCVEIEPKHEEAPDDVQSSLNLKNNQSVKLHTLIENKNTPSISSNKIILGSKPSSNKQDDTGIHILHLQKAPLILNLKSDLDAQDDNISEIHYSRGKNLKFASKSYLDTQDDTEIHILDVEDALDKKLKLGSTQNTKTQNDNDKKLILGSKPNRVRQNYNKNMDEKKTEKATFKQVKLILQDIKSYLNQNGRYCKLCCRLFLSKIALDKHKNKVHIKILKSKKGMKSKNITETRHKCNICGSYFSNKWNLYRHCRNIHQKIIKVKGNYAKSKSSKIITDSSNKIKSEKQLKCSKKIKHSDYMCNICNIEFISYESLKRHKSTHNIESSIKKNSTIVINKEEQRKVDSKNNTDSVSLKVNSIPVVKIHDKILKYTNKTKSVKEEHENTPADEKNMVDTNDVTCASNSTSKDSNLCLHCKKAFPDQKSLIEHMYQILEPKIKSSEEIKNVANSGKTKLEDGKVLYVCRQCSYYLPSVDAYFSHMTRNHKTVTFLDIKKEDYDPQCKYCSYKSSNISTHNNHIHSYHIDLMFMRIENEIETDKIKQSQVNENIYNNALYEFNSFALESVLFECSKCRICFLSSNIASNHKQHTKLVNNWTCSICHHVLKLQHKELHLKQHSFSQTLNVLNLNDTAYSNVLYNCTKCAIHFTEKRYQEHYLNCESDITDSSYCMACDILVDKAEMTHHETQHKHSKDISDFTIIDSNLILDTTTNLKRKGTVMTSEVKPSKRLYEQHNCFTYCPTCKSFLSNLGLKNKIHIKGICSHIAKYACNECGLTFTGSTLQIHKERHSKEKNLRLQDFKFFDLQGNQVHPPIPEYPHCKICKIHFLRKNDVYRHICDITNYSTCDICNIKLTEKTFKLHMSFHLYVIQKSSFTNNRYSSQNQPSYSCQPPKMLNKAKCNIKKESSNSKNITEAETQPGLILPKAATTEPKENLHRKIEPLPETTTNELIESNKIVVQKSNRTNLVEETKSSNDSLVVLYTCKICDVSVESYDEVIKHCQAHYTTKESQITSVTKCKQCSLKFESNSYLHHKRRVHSSVSKIQVLKFDLSYFTSRNMIWVKHIFKNLPEEMVKELLKNSIYQHEHRIQLECVQTGSSLLCVYQCDSCRNFIDPGNLYKHAENPCGNVRKYPCSLCGLPFISVFSRNNHEKLHKQIKKRLTKKSFSIVLFNQSKDKAFNESIFCTTNQYLLYQCRNCDRVVEKSMLTDHVCDRNSLVKCITCGLIIGQEDSKAHSSKHTDLGNFNSENFKVILFGCKTNTSDKDALKNLSPCFSGTVYDYTLYKCEICQMCIKSNNNAEKHTCIPNFDLDRSMCSECNLYFPSGNLKHHTKQHSIDPDFIKENLNVITFNNDLPQIKNSLDTVIHKRKTTTEMKHVQDENDMTNKIIKRGAYNEKDEDSDSDVIENCIEFKNDGEDSDSADVSTTIVNDTEPKNDLSTEKATKSHVDSKEIIFYNFEDKEKNKYDEMEKKLNSSLVINVQKSEIIDDGNDKSVYAAMDPKELETLYKCNCGLHFIKKLNLTEHMKDCQSKLKQYKQTCSKCHLLFSANELFTHLVFHHRNKSQVQNFKVIEISLDNQDNATKTPSRLR